MALSTGEVIGVATVSAMVMPGVLLSVGWVFKHAIRDVVFGKRNAGDSVTTNPSDSTLQFPCQYHGAIMEDIARINEHEKSAEAFVRDINVSVKDLAREYHNGHQELVESVGVIRGILIGEKK